MGDSSASSTQISTSSCDGINCDDHYHWEDHTLTNVQSLSQLEKKFTAASKGPEPEKTEKKAQNAYQKPTLRHIIQNFTPSWFIITMSTGITSICLHQLPYNGNWLQIVSVIFFVLNILLFLLFTVITCIRYICYPSLIPVVLRHHHQSIFIATFPIGLSTLINLTVLVCVPVWGQGVAIFAWVLWWIDIVLALAICFHLTFTIMSNRRGELAEVTALYLIPILAVVITATSGGLVANVLHNQNNSLWTLFICYILWGIGSPLSWIVLTIYLLRLTLHKPLQREVIVTLLLPIGALSLSGFCLVVLGKLAKRLFPLTHSLPNVTSTHPGDVFYIFGVFAGMILWGFAIIWFVMAVVMIALARRFPFNMGWWGFIFPVGVFTLLTITLGEELESKFFKVLSCVFTVACVIMWLIVAAGTIRASLSGKLFYAPCLGTNLYSTKKLKKSGRDETEAAAAGTQEA